MVMPSNSNESLKKEGVSPNLQHLMLVLVPDAKQLIVNSHPIVSKGLLDQIKNSRMILSFDPLDFKLKLFSWYIFFCIDYHVGLNWRPGLRMAANV